MRKILFLDRDGTLIVEPPDQQIDSLEKLEFIPGVFEALSAIVKTNQYELVMVTNQDGLGTHTFPENTFWPAHEKMLKAFENERIKFSKIHIDRSRPEDNLPTRKPGTGMLLEYFSREVDMANSYVIGDRLTDVQLAKNLGCKAILFLNSIDVAVDCPITNSWKEIADLLTKPNRTAIVNRKTNETNITIELNLDGSGKSNIKTGLGFFDHMLDQLARHGGLDLSIQVKGDLHIDEHHTIERHSFGFRRSFSASPGQQAWNYALWVFIADG